MSDLAELRQLLIARSVRRGDFVLASGERSDVYVDCRLTTLHGPAMPLIGRAVLAAMQRRGWAPRAIGGLTMGADPIACATARESLSVDGAPLDAFSVRKQPKGHGRGRRVEGLEHTAGTPVVVIEDVCTSGGSAASAIEAAREAGMEVLGCVCLVDREAGGRERIEALDCAFERVFTMEELTGPRAPQETAPADARPGGIA
jgi:orotate phosphoribosyltransferase